MFASRIAINLLPHFLHSAATVLILLCRFLASVRRRAAKPASTKTKKTRNRLCKDNWSSAKNWKDCFTFYTCAWETNYWSEEVCLIWTWCAYWSLKVCAFLWTDWLCLKEAMTFYPVSSSPPPTNSHYQVTITPCSTTETYYRGKREHGFRFNQNVLLRCLIIFVQPGSLIQQVDAFLRHSEPENLSKSDVWPSRNVYQPPMFMFLNEIDLFDKIPWRGLRISVLQFVFKVAWLKTLLLVEKLLFQQNNYYTILNQTWTCTINYWLLWCHTRRCDDKTVKHLSDLPEKKLWVQRTSHKGHANNMQLRTKSMQQIRGVVGRMK